MDDKANNLTIAEQLRLAWYKSEAGEREWRVSDPAWAEYQRLLDKERGVTYG